MASLKKPIDWDELYPGRFLKAGELQSRKITLTMSSVDLDEMESDKGKKIKGIISFAETPKQLPLNKTNGLCLRAMFGRKLSDWVGKRVTIFPDVWNGEPCIRVWGSPDIEADTQAVITLPRKRPTMMVMHRVVKGAAATQQAAPARAPVSVDDPYASRETGDDGDFGEDPRGEEFGTGAAS